MNTDLQPSPNGGPELGKRIRAHRKAKGLSIRDLAAQSGLSNGMISQIEQGKSSPSLRSLRLISEVLKVPTATLFGTVSTPISADHGLAASCVVRRSARQVLKLNGAVLKELMSPASLHHLEIFNVELQPGGNSGPDLYSHTGEKAGIVLEGLLRLQLGEEIVELNAGDVCQFSGEIEHRYENAGTEVCKVIWVLTPPAG